MYFWSTHTLTHTLADEPPISPHTNSKAALLPNQTKAVNVTAVKEIVFVLDSFAVAGFFFFFKGQQWS